jgi:aryl-alcohol dehydrogenase-like predicted oxidoreductase
MEKRKFGNIEVSAIGLGCMGFTHAYGQGPTEEESIRLVHLAYENGCNLFDTAEMYSCLKNEIFVGKALKELSRDKIIISDKFWPTKLQGQEDIKEKLSEEGIRKCFEASLKRLQTTYIDLYILHAMDEEHLEEVARVMGLLIKEGKIRGWGLSSPTAEQLIKAHKITPVSVVQSEYSMMERKWEKDIIPLCKKLNIGFQAFSPMGNGFLSGKYTANNKFEKNDLRTVITRFKEENIKANQPLLELIGKFAKEKNCTNAQIALAWVLRGGDFIVPIPGMRREERIKENLGAIKVKLTDDEYNEINKELDKITIYGDRDSKDIAKLSTVPNDAH